MPSQYMLCTISAIIPCSSGSVKIAFSDIFFDIPLETIDKLGVPVSNEWTLKTFLFGLLYVFRPELMEFSQAEMLADFFLNFAHVHV